MWNVTPRNVQFRRREFLLGRVVLNVAAPSAAQGACVILARTASTQGRRHWVPNTRAYEACTPGIRAHVAAELTAA